MEDRRFGYVVICTDAEADGSTRYHLATRQVFATEGEAQTYAGTVADTRAPIVVNGRWFELRWADVHAHGASVFAGPAMLDCLAVPCPDCDAARGFPCTAGGRPRPPHVSRFRSFVTR